MAKPGALGSRSETTTKSPISRARRAASAASTPPETIRMVLSEIEAAIDVDCLCRDVGGSIAGQKDRDFADFILGSEAFEQDVLCRLLHRSRLHAGRRHFGGDQSRRHGVGADAVGGAEPRDDLR